MTTTTTKRNKLEYSAVQVYKDSLYRLRELRYMLDKELPPYAVLVEEALSNYKSILERRLESSDLHTQKVFKESEGQTYEGRNMGKGKRDA